VIVNKIGQEICNFVAALYCKAGVLSFKYDIGDIAYLRTLSEGEN
jgi:hypothetical protein